MSVRVHLPPPPLPPTQRPAALMTVRVRLLLRVSPTLKNARAPPISGKDICPALPALTSRQLFLHIHDMGTNVCDPNAHSKPPDVDIESRMSPANEASWNETSFAVLNLTSHMTDLPVVLGVMDVALISEIELGVWNAFLYGSS